MIKLSQIGNSNAVMSSEVEISHAALFAMSVEAVRDSSTPLRSAQNDIS